MDYRFCSQVGENKVHPTLLLFKDLPKNISTSWKLVHHRLSQITSVCATRTQMFCWQTVSQTHRAITWGNGCKQAPLACLLIIVTWLISTWPWLKEELASCRKLWSSCIIWLSASFDCYKQSCEKQELGSASAHLQKDLSLPSCWLYQSLNTPENLFHLDLPAYFYLSHLQLVWYTKKRPGALMNLTVFLILHKREGLVRGSLAWNPSPEQTVGYSAPGESAHKKPASQQRLVLHRLDCWSLNTVLFKWKQGCATVPICNQMILLLSANFLSSYTHTLHFASSNW